MRLQSILNANEEGFFLITPQGFDAETRMPVSVSTANRRAFIATAAGSVLLASRLVLAPSLAHAATEKVWRVGVIGHTGRGDFGHGLHTVWLDLPEAKMVGLADADRNGLVNAQRKLKAENAFADYREMLKQVRPEIVAVCPRHVDQHHEMILAAIDSGAQGIYCEKSFCRTPQEADEIIAACKRTGTKLGIAHRNRYHPALPQAALAIQEGAIGKLLEIRCRGKEDGRGGAQDLWVLGTHLFNLAEYFSGRATACSAVLLADSRPVTAADIVEGPEGIGPIAGNRLHARYETVAGIPVFFDSIRDAGVAAAGFGIQLVGTEGLIDLRIDTEPLVHFVPGNPFRPTLSPRPWIPITSAGIGQPEPIPDITKLVANHTLPTRDLIAAITDDRAPQCSDEDGRATVEMVHATFASHVKNGERIQLPLASRTHPFDRW